MSITKLLLLQHLLASSWGLVIGFNLQLKQQILNEQDRFVGYNNHIHVSLTESESKLPANVAFPGTIQPC